MQAYLLGGETEFWRAYRRCAGVLHFVYLTASDPKAFTSDHFRNLQRLELEPHFAKTMEQVLNPLGIYLNFWHPTLNTGEEKEFTIAMVNDEDRRGPGYCAWRLQASTVHPTRLKKSPSLLLRWEPTRTRSPSRRPRRQESTLSKRSHVPRMTKTIRPSPIVMLS